MYVCICNAVTDGEIRETYARGARTFDALQDELGVAACCGCCEPAVRDVLARCQADEQACCSREGMAVDVGLTILQAG